LRDKRESSLFHPSENTTDHHTFNVNWHERGFTEKLSKEECSDVKTKASSLKLNACLAQALFYNKRD
jgi:hypothetical protein